MSKITKNVNFSYNDVESVSIFYKTEGSDEVPLTRVIGKNNEWKFIRLDGNTNTYTSIRMFDVEGNELAEVSDISIDINITNFYFKYIITESNIEFEDDGSSLNIEIQYSGDGGHNEKYVKYSELISPEEYNFQHFNDECDHVRVSQIGKSEISSVPSGYSRNIKFNKTKFNNGNFGLPSSIFMKLNTLTTYFISEGLVIGCLYKNNNDYYYLIKYSNPSGRNRLIKLPNELGKEYELSGVFQLTEAFDNIIICTGKNLYTYNISDTRYLPIANNTSNRSGTDTCQTEIFDLSSVTQNISHITDTISNDNDVENFYAFYLPLDIDYCKRFLAVKLNSYNCYEFHMGNLLPGYNIDDTDIEVHHIHCNEQDKEQSTLTYEEFKSSEGYTDKEGTEFDRSGGMTTLINDTDPYTNYDSYSSSNDGLNDIGKMERYLLCELYLTLKHGVNCVNGRGDLLGKFKYFRILESGLCKFTKSQTSNALIVVIYSNLISNPKKYIFKISYESSTSAENMEFNELNISNIYVQLSNDKLVINWYDLINNKVYSSGVKDLSSNELLDSNKCFKLNEVNSINVDLLYKGQSFKIDNNLDIVTTNSGS